MSGTSTATYLHNGNLVKEVTHDFPDIEGPTTRALQGWMKRLIVSVGNSTNTSFSI